jgi:N6-L-threonylcarbamoyladenine synthase
MSGRDIVIGVDTSNYTTSVGLIYTDGELLGNIKKPLAVKEGERGLRQSDAVFSHVKNMPSAMEDARRLLDGRTPVAVGVSSRPRNIDGSYMPCFLSGVAVAESISASLGVPLYRFSHQCGHIMSALYSSGLKCEDNMTFGAFHLSGGTTELLHVTRSGPDFISRCVGGTKDLNAGQIVDRVGVYLGMPFPAGPHLELKALGYDGEVQKKKPSVSGTFANLSGLENMAVDLYKRTDDVCHVAAFVFNYIADSIILMCEEYLSIYGDMPLVFAGGVMCNSIIRSKISARFDSYFAEPMLSADNAVGIAELTRRAYLGL